MCQQTNIHQPTRHTHARWTHHLFITNSFTSTKNSPYRSTTSTHIPRSKKTKALLSICMFCDNRCLAIFDDKKFYIIDKRTNNMIMHGTRYKRSTLYMVPLTTQQNEDMTECKIPEHHFARSVYEEKSKSDLSTFPHLACWIPCTSTMTTAIKNNFLFTWLGLTK